MSKTVFLSVGEPSGDQHAARLIQAIRNRAVGDNGGEAPIAASVDPAIRFRGFGGPEMGAAGCQLDLNLTEHAVMGILEVLPKLRQFFGFVDQAEAIFARGEVDALLLVDFPGFNWHMAKRAKKYGIPVYYYCPPQLWAWGGWRVKKMKRLIDHVLCVLPIEQEYFSAHGIETTFVGHPFFDAVAEVKLDPAVMHRLGHDHSDTRGSGPLVAVLPGSRGHEVRRTWPIMLQAIRRLHQRFPDARFAVACHRDSQCKWCDENMQVTDRELPIDLHVGCTSEIIESAHCAMMVSGSVSLEMMARRTPAVVVYRVGRFLYAFGKCVVSVDSVTLPNLMNRSARTAPGNLGVEHTPQAGLSHEKVFPEMISVGREEPAVEFLTESVGSMLGDEFYYRRKLAQLDDLNRQFAQPGGTGIAAQWLCERLGVPMCPDQGPCPVQEPCSDQGQHPSRSLGSSSLRRAG